MNTWKFSEVSSSSKSSIPHLVPQFREFSLPLPGFVFPLQLHKSTVSLQQRRFWKAHGQTSTAKLAKKAYSRGIDITKIASVYTWVCQSGRLQMACTGCNKVWCERRICSAIWACRYWRLVKFGEPSRSWALQMARRQCNRWFSSVEIGMNPRISGVKQRRRSWNK